MFLGLFTVIIVRFQGTAGAQIAWIAFFPLDRAIACRDCKIAAGAVPSASA
jgi:hypothetical protein